MFDPSSALCRDLLDALRSMTGPKSVSTGAQAELRMTFVYRPIEPLSVVPGLGCFRAPGCEVGGRGELQNPS